MPYNLNCPHPEHGDQVLLEDTITYMNSKNLTEVVREEKTDRFSFEEAAALVAQVQAHGWLQTNEGWGDYGAGDGLQQVGLTIVGGDQ